MIKISIITVTYNSAETVEDTIQSVQSQDFKNIEHLIIDGVSKDQTLDIINNYREKISAIISEPDKGLYDALNKGIKLATGDVIGILHSDDVFENNHVLSNIAMLFEKDQNIEGVYGDLNFVEKENTNKIVRKWVSGNYTTGKFRKGWMPPHPTFYVKKSVYDKYGDFNTDFIYAADYELMLRFIHKHEIKIAYLPQVIIKMRMGGISNTNISNKLKANKEDRLAWKVNGLSMPWYTTIAKPLLKIGQYLKKEES